MSEQEPTVFDSPESHLEGLGQRFLLAMAARDKNDLDAAAELLRSVLRVEPRLGEPQMELARILLETEQLDEAEEHAREAVRIFEGGGQWTDDLPENVVLSMAWDLLGEILRSKADSDEVVFGDPGRFEGLMTEAKAAFLAAVRLDPTNEHAATWAFGFDPASVLAEEQADKAPLDEEPELPEDPELPEA